MPGPSSELNSGNHSTTSTTHVGDNTTTNTASTNMTGLSSHVAPTPLRPVSIAKFVQQSEKEPMEDHFQVETDTDQQVTTTVENTSMTNTSSSSSSSSASASSSASSSASTHSLHSMSSGNSALLQSPPHPQRTYTRQTKSASSSVTTTPQHRPSSFANHTNPATLSTSTAHHTANHHPHNSSSSSSSSSSSHHHHHIMPPPHRASLPPNLNMPSVHGTSTLPPQHHIPRHQPYGGNYFIGHPSTIYSSTTSFQRPSSAQPFSHPSSSLHSPDSMRGDGFLLENEDADDELSNIDDSMDGSHSIVQKHMHNNNNNNMNDDSLHLPVDNTNGSAGNNLAFHTRNSIQRPASVDPSFFSSLSSTSSNSNSTVGFSLFSDDESANENNDDNSTINSSKEDDKPILECPTCKKTSSEIPENFHTHISKCFVKSVSHTLKPSNEASHAHLHSSKKGAIPELNVVSTPQHSNKEKANSKTGRARAASAAYATSNEAAVAAAIHHQHHTPKSSHTTQTPDSTHASPAFTPTSFHGYHPYNNPSNNVSPASAASALRNLRLAAEKLDLHQRLTIMEAFRRLSKAAGAEQQAAAAQQQASVYGPSPRGGKRFRSATSSPSPKLSPMAEDKMCQGILQLLYSPRVTPKPVPMRNSLVAPSPLNIPVAVAPVIPNALALSISITGPELADLPPNGVTSPLAMEDTHRTSSQSLFGNNVTDPADGVLSPSGFSGLPPLPTFSHTTSEDSNDLSFADQSSVTSSPQSLNSSLSSPTNQSHTPSVQTHTVHSHQSNNTIHHGAGLGEIKELNSTIYKDDFEFDSNSNVRQTTQPQA